MTKQAETPRTLETETQTPTTEAKTAEAKPAPSFKLRSGLRAGYVWD